MLLRPASVAEPFGLGGPPPVQLAEVAGVLRRPAAQRHPRRGRVPTERRRDRRRAASRSPTTIWSSRSARARPTRSPAPCRSAAPPTSRRSPRLLDERGSGRRADDRLRRALRRRAGRCPVYELAMMAAADLRAPRRGHRDPVVTAEPAPLWLFGEPAGEAIAELLAARGIRLRARPRHGLRGRPRSPWRRVRRMRPTRSWSSRRSRAHGSAGSPGDDQGFVPVDELGRVDGRRGRLGGGRRHGLPDQAGRPGLPAGGHRRHGHRGASSARPPSRSPFRPVLRGSAAHRRRAALPARRARPPRRGTAARRHRDCAARSRPARCGGRRARWPAATSRPTSPPRGPARWVASRWPIVPRRRPAQPPAAPATRSSSRCCSPTRTPPPATSRQALHALDAAAALSGGVLPADAARRRDAWRPRAATPVPRPSHIEIEEEP